MMQNAVDVQMSPKVESKMLAEEQERVLQKTRLIQKLLQIEEQQQLQLQMLKQQLELTKQLIEQLIQQQQPQHQEQQQQELHQQVQKQQQGNVPPKKRGTGGDAPPGTHYGGTHEI